MDLTRNKTTQKSPFKHYIVKDVFCEKELSEIKKLFNKDTKIYTVENHLKNGGLGDLISEKFNNPVERIGLERKFITEYGSYEDLRKIAGMDTKSILEKIYDKGLAAWRTGHRPGVQQHQWAAGRVYAFVVGADSSTGPGKPDHKLAVEAGVR